MNTLLNTKRKGFKNILKKKKIRIKKHFENVKAYSTYLPSKGKIPFFLRHFENLLNHKE